MKRACPDCETDVCELTTLQYGIGESATWQVKCLVSGYLGPISSVSSRQARKDYNATRPSGDRELTGTE